jgi:hypothetical protein
MVTSFFFFLNEGGRSPLGIDAEEAVADAVEATEEDWGIDEAADVSETETAAVAPANLISAGLSLRSKLYSFSSWMSLKKRVDKDSDARRDRWSILTGEDGLDESLTNDDNMLSKHLRLIAAPTKARHKATAEGLVCCRACVKG